MKRDRFNEMHQGIIMYALIVDMIKRALNDIPKEKTEVRRDLIRIGRLAADARYTLEDWLQFIEHLKPYPEISDDKINISEEEMRILICSEHKALGLDAPEFQASKLLDFKAVD